MRYWTRKLKDGEGVWMPERCRVRVYRQSGPYDLIPGEEITAHKCDGTAHINKDDRLPFLHVLHHEDGSTTTFIASQLLGVDTTHCQEVQKTDPGLAPCIYCSGKAPDCGCHKQPASLLGDLPPPHKGTPAQKADSDLASLWAAESPQTGFISAASISTPRSIMRRTPAAATEASREAAREAAKTFIDSYLSRSLVPSLRELVRKFFPPQSEFVHIATQELANQKDPLAVSMGCKIARDECCLCKAKDCEHLSPGPKGGFPEGEITSLVAWEPPKRKASNLGWFPIHDEIQLVLTPAQAKRFARSPITSPHFAIGADGKAIQFLDKPFQPPSEDDETFLDGGGI